MQGGFNPQQPQEAQAVNAAYQQFMNQQQQGGFNPQQGQQFGQGALQASRQMQSGYGKMMNTVPQGAEQFGQQQNTGIASRQGYGALQPAGQQLGGTPQQDRDADDPQRQPRMQQPQRQGGPRGRTMPQAPTAQQAVQEAPRMQAMRNMQRMRLGDDDD
jgi:hypothetical protein